MLSKNDNGDYIISPKTAGPEAAAFGAGFAPDLEVTEAIPGIELGSEVATGSLLSYTIYTAVLTTLDTVKDVKAGRITKAEQREIILDRTWQSAKGAVPIAVILGCLLLLFPWLTPVAGLAGWVGGGVMAVRLVRSALSALDEEQIKTIKVKAQEVGVEVPGITSPASA